MRRLALALILVAVGVTPGGAQLPFPLPVPRSCEEDRDHLRQLVKMIADNRGGAEWALAEALAKVQRLETEVNRLQGAPPGPKEGK